MDLETHIDAIKERNQRVELDKAWEQSWTRRLLITAITYACAAFFFWINELPIPLLQGVIPAGGYLLSTLSMPWVKGLWIRHGSGGS